MINPQRKGKDGERDWRDKVREHGFDARRGCQYSGSPESPDVISEDLARFHFEVKRTQNISFYPWMAQAITDCMRKGVAKIPVVAHRKNHGEWHVFIKADDFLNLLKSERQTK